MELGWVSVVYTADEINFVDKLMEQVHIDGFMQNSRNSITNTLLFSFFSINPWRGGTELST